MIRRPSPAVAISVVLHILLAVALVGVVIEPRTLGWVLPQPEAEPPKAERIQYVAVAPSPPDRPLPPSQLGRAGGDGRDSRPEARRSAPIVAPSGVPTVLPPATPRTDEAGGTGPLVGGGGPLRGVQPRYGDPRVWVPPDEAAPQPRTHKERIDSAFAVRFKEHQDSMAVVARRRKPGDWTVAREDGTKYGVEPGENGSMPKLWLGRIAIPLPLGIGAQPERVDRDRALRMITSDLAQQAPRRLTEDEFRKAVREIRSRKEWERSRTQAAREKTDAQESAPAPVQPSGPRE